MYNQKFRGRKIKHSAPTTETAKPQTGDLVSEYFSSSKFRHGIILRRREHKQGSQLVNVFSHVLKSRVSYISTVYITGDNDPAEPPESPSVMKQHEAKGGGASEDFPPRKRSIPYGEN